MQEDGTRIALIGIIVENYDKVDVLNTTLHDYAQYIIGRMGLPYEKKSVSIISVVIDAPTSITSAISGRLGMIQGVAAKTNTAKI